MDRSNWDTSAIDALAKSVMPKERELSLFLGILFSKVSPSIEVVYANSSKGQMERYDLEIRMNNRLDTPKTLLRIECEFGMNQTAWKNTLPSNWYALSLLARKDYSKSDVFLKHNADMTSMFAVDCKWLVESIKSGNIKKITRGHNLNIETCSEFYQIPLNTARNTPEHVIVSENSNFNDLRGFLKKKIIEAKSLGKYD